MLKSIRLAFMSIAMTLCLGSMAQAAVLDFSVFSSGDTGLSSLPVGDATVNVPTGTVFVYQPGDFGAFTTSGGLCPLSGTGFNCQTDWSLDFNYGVTNLIFETAFFGTGDSVQIEWFDGATSLGSLGRVADDPFGVREGLPCRVAGGHTLAAQRNFAEGAPQRGPREVQRGHRGGGPGRGLGGPAHG